MSRIGLTAWQGETRRSRGRTAAHDAHGGSSVACRWMGRVTSVNPPSWPPTFPFFACCPTGHLPIHLGPVLLITRLGLRMRTNVPPFGDVLCPEKRYQYTRAFFHAFSLSLSPPSRVLSLSLSVCVFFTLVATKGPLSVARRARLFYTPNVIQPRSYLKLFLSLSLSRFRFLYPWPCIHLSLSTGGVSLSF